MHGAALRRTEGGRRRQGLLAGLLAVLVALMVALPQALAQEVGPRADEAAPSVSAPVIIVVDFQAVLRDSQAVASIEAQMEGLRAGLQEQFATIERDLRRFEQELSEDRERLNEEAFLARRREFEQRVTAAQREAQTRRSELDRIHDEALSEVRVALLQVIAGIAQDVGANIVLSKNQVILADRSFDYTDEALALLDDTIPNVEIDRPAFGDEVEGDDGEE